MPTTDPKSPDEESKNVPKSNSVDTAYFKSKISGLSVHFGPPEENQVAPQTERFTPYYEMFQGDQIKVGYLKTKNPIVIQKCRNDFNVEEIDKYEYKKATNSENPEVKQATI
jgi:hypothetical protein